MDDEIDAASEPEAPSPEDKLDAAVAIVGRILGRRIIDELMLEPAREIGWAWVRRRNAPAVPGPVVFFARHGRDLRVETATRAVLEGASPLPSALFPEFRDAWCVAMMHEHLLDPESGDPHETYLSWHWPRDHSARCRGCGWVWDARNEAHEVAMYEAVMVFVAGGSLGMASAMAALARADAAAVTPSAPAPAPVGPPPPEEPPGPGAGAASS